jgi:hypothetical protein
MNIRVILVAEMVVRKDAAIADLNAKVGAFREAVLPSDHGITLYQATAEDLVAFAGSLWTPSDADAVTCELCQCEIKEIGDCGYRRGCCEIWCAQS